MNSIDGIVLIWLVFSILRGYHTGLIRQAASFMGFLIGVVAGSKLAPIFFGGIEDAGSLLLATVVLILGLGLIGAAFCEFFALKLQKKMHFDLAKRFNSVFGAVFSAGTTLILAWLLLSTFNRLPLADMGLNISESVAYRQLEKVMPPAPALIERLGQAVTPNGFPQIFVNDEPEMAPIVSAVAADVERAAEKAIPSVVRIEGFACGDIASGSGFIAAPEYIVTNAHVVAGVSTPIVVRGGEKYRTVPVWFNDRLDFAVLRTVGLNGPVLPVAGSAPERGQSGAVLGYPGGGGLTVVPGVMRGRYPAVGRDIYGQGLITRDILEINASIRPGNSGGPFVLPDGSVAGMMFGASTKQENASYAITSMEIASELRQAIDANLPVATGDCI